MFIQPSFQDVAALAVDGTRSILLEAERRFGPVGRRLSRQEEDDIHTIQTMLTELLARLFDDQTPVNNWNIGANNGRARYAQRDQTSRHPEHR